MTTSQTPQTGLEVLDCQIDVIVKYMARLQIAGAHPVMDQKGNISYSWDNPVMEKQYNIQKGLLQQKMEERNSYHA